MAVKRPFTVAAVAVVLLLCLSSAFAAKPQETDPKAVDAALASITSLKTVADASEPADVLPSSTSGPAAAEHLDKTAAAVSEPQHAPQFPEEPSPVRKGQQQNPPSAPVPPKEQQPAVAPTPAAAAPSKPEEPKQQQEAKPEPQADAPKSDAPAAEAHKKTEAPQPQPEAQNPKSETPKADSPKAVDALKADAPKADAPKADAPKSDKKGDVTDAFEDARRKNEEAHKKPEPQEKKEPENPCKRVPGCMECKPFDPKDPILFEGFGLRRLRESWDANSMVNSMNMNMNGQGQKQDKKPKNRIELNPLDMVDSPYSAKDLPLCITCNTTGGYVQHSRGRCACKPGYGDTAPTGHCNRCPHGYFSQGGFRAVCVECEGVAFSNSDHTACVCASGWYGVTSYATKQASCNQCPGTRPVSKEGARSSTDCRACPEGEQPNEIYSDCVDPNKIPEPVAAPEVPEKPEEDKKTPKIKPLFNSTTFEKTREEWTITSRNTQNHTNLFTDFIGSIMDSVMTNKNVTATARTPGELLYQMISKPAAPVPKLPTLPNIDMQNPAQLGAGVGAALSAVPAVLGGALQNGGKISDVVDSVAKAVETGSQSAGNDMAATSNGWDAFLKGLSTTAPKDSAGKSELADFAKSLGDLFGAAGKVATDVAAKSDNTLVKSIGGMLSAAQKGETVEVPLTGEAAMIASPEGEAPAKPDNSWSSMLSGLLGGGQQAAAPAAEAPAAAEAAPAAGNDWTKLLSGLTKTAPVPAEPAPSAGSTGDILKMLSGLTAQKKPEPSSNPHTITVKSAGYKDTDKPVLSNSVVTPDAPSADSMSNILSALKQYTNTKTETRGQQGGDTLTTTTGQQTVSKDQPAAGSFSNLLGGLLGKPAAAGKKTFSFATLNGGSMHLKDKVLQAQAQTQRAAEGFISVPSAPPKGSAAIKSGKVGAGKAKTMGGKKNKAQQ